MPRSQASIDFDLELNNPSDTIALAILTQEVAKQGVVFLGSPMIVQNGKNVLDIFNISNKEIELNGGSQIATVVVVNCVLSQRTP